jgi:hypothetical protein
LYRSCLTLFRGIFVLSAIWAGDIGCSASRSTCKIAERSSVR